MRLDLYQAETAHIAQEQSSLLDEARSMLLAGKTPTRLEQNGILHALQILVENAIGKAKQLLKAVGEPVPVSAYDSFSALATQGRIAMSDLQAWNAIIGLRNRIVHDYMNIDMALVLELVRTEQYHFVAVFLLAPIEAASCVTHESGL